MTAVRLTVAEARRLGLLDAGVTAQPSKSVRRRRQKAPPYLTRCHACGAEQHSEAAQTKHRRSTGHRRYEIPLENLR